MSELIIFARTIVCEITNILYTIVRDQFRSMASQVANLPFIEWQSALWYMQGHSHSPGFHKHARATWLCPSRGLLLLQLFKPRFYQLQPGALSYASFPWLFQIMWCVSTLVDISVLLFWWGKQTFLTRWSELWWGGRTVCCRGCICSKIWKVQRGYWGHLQVLCWRWR